jgi:predicted site-specific integrase-resolvase
MLPKLKEILPSELDGQRWVLPVELARKKKVSCQTVYNWVKSGRLNARRFFGRVIVQEKKP